MTKKLNVTGNLILKVPEAEAIYKLNHNQLTFLYIYVNCRLPPVIDGCFKDVLQQWLLFFAVDCRLPSDGSH